jgi:hypothetical protein
MYSMGPKKASRVISCLSLAHTQVLPVMCIPEPSLFHSPHLLHRELADLLRSERRHHVGAEGLQRGAAHALDCHALHGRRQLRRLLHLRTTTRKVANRNVRVWHGGDRKWSLERWTTPTRSRRTCACEYGLQSCRGKSAGVVKRPRGRSRFATFASLYGGEWAWQAHRRTRDSHWFPSLYGTRCRHSSRGADSTFGEWEQGVATRTFLVLMVLNLSCISLDSEATCSGVNAASCAAVMPSSCAAVSAFTCARHKRVCGKRGLGWEKRFLAEGAERTEDTKQHQKTS